jgi:hypothetical protein
MCRQHPKLNRRTSDCPAPNADGEPEQVLWFYAGMPAQKLLTSDAVFEPMQGESQASFLEVDLESQSE